MLKRSWLFVIAFATTSTTVLPAQSSARRPAAPKKTAAPAPIKLTLAPTGNQARFIVREQLAGHELPNDAIGTTGAITGGIVLDGKGGVDSLASKIVVDLTTLQSDQARRDRYIKGRTIQTDSFPTATLVVTKLTGLPAVLPGSGSLSFTVEGTLTIHGVSRVTQWPATASAGPDGFTGKASTHIHFGEYNMTQPRVAVVLSVVDDVTLEYDFHFVHDAATGASGASSPAAPASSAASSR